MLGKYQLGLSRNTRRNYVCTAIHWREIYWEVIICSCFQVKACYYKVVFELALSTKSILGLPCVQPYTKEKHFATQTPLQSVNSNSPAPDMPVNKRKQKSAFPPNFIHSQVLIQYTGTYTIYIHRYLSLSSNFY